MGAKVSELDFKSKLFALELQAIGAEILNAAGLRNPSFVDCTILGLCEKVFEMEKRIKDLENPKTGDT